MFVYVSVRFIDFNPRHFDNLEASTSVFQPRRKCVCVCLYFSLCICLYMDICSVRTSSVEVIQLDPGTRYSSQWERLWHITPLEALLLFTWSTIYQSPSLQVFCFMRVVNVFTVQTYFQANEADGCTLSPHLYQVSPRLRTLSSPFIWSGDLQTPVCVYRPEIGCFLPVWLSSWYKLRPCV